MQDSHGTTPLTFAAQAGQQNSKVYDLLVQNGANLKTDVSVKVPMCCCLLRLTILN